MADMKVLTKIYYTLGTTTINFLHKLKMTVFQLFY